MLYFAYASNMDWVQMRERCPSAQFVCIARLPGHRLAFTRKSIKRGCGVADGVPDEHLDLWGVVYEVSERDFGNLDRSEGYVPGRETNAYTRDKREVLADGDEHKPVTVCIYFARKEPNPPLPNEEYKHLIVEGAKFWRLPAEYIARLEEVET
ncbi:MAG: gamma-glutamylcyclotransferase family protein [Candidatus Acidiferrales bacterium]